MVVKKVSNFKQFNESKDFLLSKSDIEEIFIDLVDDGYLLTIYNTSDLLDSLYFDLRKQFIREFDVNLDPFKYGCQDLDSIMKEISKVLDVLKTAQTRLKSMDYEIGFEPEFNFSEDSLICITCRVAHTSVKDEDVYGDL